MPPKSCPIDPLPDYTPLIGRLTADWTSVPVFGVPSTAHPSTVRPSVYALFCDTQPRIAVVRTPLGVFLPGGGIDGDESVEAAMTREVREECGLEVRVGQWRRRAVEHTYSVAEHMHFEKRSTFCDAEVNGVAGDAIELDHVLEWMTVADAVSSLTPPSHRWAITEWATAPSTPCGEALPR